MRRADYLCPLPEFSTGPLEVPRKEEKRPLPEDLGEIQPEVKDQIRKAYNAFSHPKHEDWITDDTEKLSLPEHLKVFCEEYYRLLLKVLLRYGFMAIVFTYLLGPFLGGLSTCLFLLCMTFTRLSGFGSSNQDGAPFSISEHFNCSAQTLYSVLCDDKLITQYDTLLRRRNVVHFDPTTHMSYQIDKFELEDRFLLRGLVSMRECHTKSYRGRDKKGTYYVVN